MTARRKGGPPGSSPGEERRRHPRLDALETGVIMLDGKLHPLVDWSIGGFLCVMPRSRWPSPGALVDVRLIVSTDGQTVSDFDLSAEWLRLNAEDGTLAARIEALHGIAAGRFESFYEECRAIPRPSGRGVSRRRRSSR